MKTETEKLQAEKRAKAKLASLLATPIMAARRTNARLAIERAGGVGKVAEKMDYGNPSYLVQMFGPNPTRPSSEKTMRRLETALGLEPLSLDKPTPGYLPPEPSKDSPPGSRIDVAQLSRALALVGKLTAEEKVQLSSDRFASLVSIAYEDSAERAGQPSESKLRQVVQLLR